MKIIRYLVRIGGIIVLVGGIGKFFDPNPIPALAYAVTATCLGVILIGNSLIPYKNY